MNRSIDLLEELARESDNVFRHEPARLSLRHRRSRAGRPSFVRVRARKPPRWARAPCGVTTAAAATTARRRPTASRAADRHRRHHRPRAHPPRTSRWLTEDTVALLHARRCGWFSGQQLGMYMLERARDKGVRLLEGRVEAVETRGGRVQRGAGEWRTAARGRSRRRASSTPPGRSWAASPDSSASSSPVFCERHGKVAFNDVLGAIPRSAPLTIWCDPVRLPWSDEERSRAGGLRAPASAGRVSRRRPRPPGGRGREPVSPADLDLRRRPGDADVPRRVRSELRGDHDPRDGAHGPGAGRLPVTRCRARSSTAATTPRRARTACCPGRCRSRAPT